MLIGAAPAEITAHTVSNLFCRRVGVLSEEPLYCHDLARRTVAALHRAGVDEGLLHRVQLVARGQTFDGCDFDAAGIGGERDA